MSDCHGELGIQQCKQALTGGRIVEGPGASGVPAASQAASWSVSRC